MDSKVRELRDQFCTISWSRQLYNGMYFTPEREFVENSITFTQENVNGKVRTRYFRVHQSLKSFPVHKSIFKSR